MVRKFDTYVENLKYKVLKEVAKQAFDGTLIENLSEIPVIIHPSKIPTMRCCVYKERAILSKRVKLAMGGKKGIHAVEVIDIACDECPAAGYEVTDTCRGCLAHRCESACHRGAISFDFNHVAHIDKNKCVECGMCAKVCPFFAIVNRKRPCQNACKVKAITINDQNVASIDHDKCISCGSCVYQCPFGAIMDKSYILPVIDMIKEQSGHLYAVVAPAIVTQFTYATQGQVVSGLEKFGFKVVEAALGADMVAYAEAKELSEKGFLMSSCCPAFVEYVRTAFPELMQYVSHQLSPMATIAKRIKESDDQAKVVFIGPCVSKKSESQLEHVKPYIDAVLTFEELQAMFDSRDIDISKLEDKPLAGASFYGRSFARSGGVAGAIKRGIEEHGLDFKLESCVCNGIEECHVALIKKSKGVLSANFIEGMACSGGCIGGAGCLSHGEIIRSGVESYAKKGLNSISEAVKDVCQDEK